LDVLNKESVAQEGLEKSERPLVVVGIPAFNEEKNIAKTVLNVKRYVDRVVVCDDGSSDMTGEIASRLGAIVVRHERNMGYGASIASLFFAADRMGADFLVTIDGDGQHDPSQISRLLDPIKQGDADLVIGSRFIQSDDLKAVPSYRKFGLGIINGLAKKLSYEKLTDSQSGFRAYDSAAIKLLRPAEQGMGASTEILLKAQKAGLSLKEVPITITYDADSSTQNPVSHGVDVVLSTIKQGSMRHPLIFYGLPGVASLLIGLFFWVWTFQNFALTRAVETNVALMAIGTTMVGLMLMTTAAILWVLISVVRERRAGDL
jgi:glycosyltransferase involved in cell wall biosynthesis